VIEPRAVSEKLVVLRRRIESTGRDADSVRIVAVTKGFGPEAVSAAVGAGLVDVGENYAQDLVAKAERLDAGIASAVRWHFLGAVQRNKVARLAPHVHLWHGVDRVSAGAEVARRDPGAAVLVQVNLSGDPGRNGCDWAEVNDVVGALQKIELDVRGLMGVASVERERSASEFARLARVRNDLGLAELSMGMTDDLEVAVEAGSTMIRIGRALFGERPGAHVAAAEVRR
jgi:PLP dependent protein